MSFLAAIKCTGGISLITCFYYIHYVTWYYFTIKLQYFIIKLQKIIIKWFTLDKFLWTIVLWRLSDWFTSLFWIKLFLTKRTAINEIFSCYPTTHLYPLRCLYQCLIFLNDISIRVCPKSSKDIKYLRSFIHLHQKIYNLYYNDMNASTNRYLTDEDKKSKPQ